MTLPSMIAIQNIVDARKMLVYAALVVDGEVKALGRVPSVKEIKGLIGGAAAILGGSGEGREDGGNFAPRAQESSISLHSALIASHDQTSHLSSGEGIRSA